MAEVTNWQIGRKMAYPYPESRPQAQFAGVFDLNKCISCQTCTMACKTTWTSGKGQEQMFWNNVETKPYGAFPLSWDLNILSRLPNQEWKNRVYIGSTIFEAAPAGERVLGYHPETDDWIHPNIGEDEVAGLLHHGIHLLKPHALWMFYLPRICNHCTYSACVAACPRKAAYKRKEDGIVLIDQSRCRGYRECLRACPYKKVAFNSFTRLSEKCIGCFPAQEKGLLPRCFETCIGKIRMAGVIHLPAKAEEDNPVDFLVHIRKVALPLYPQFGLEPNIYYIPPVHVPPSFLIQLFGPGVEDAQKTYGQTYRDPLLNGALHLMESTDKIIRSFKIVGDHAVGYDEKKTEIVRVPLKEPTIERPSFDKKRQVYRHNIT